MTRKWLNPVNKGDILYCLFPYNLKNKPYTPAPDPHYVLVIDSRNVSGIPISLEVVYGTSKKTSPADLKPTDLLVSSNTCINFSDTGLSLPTKFEFKKRVVLPYTEDFFVLPGGKLSSYCGHIDFSQEPNLSSQMISIVSHL